MIPPRPALDESQRLGLLRIARVAIAGAIGSDEAGAGAATQGSSGEGGEPEGVLEEPWGAFVSVHVDGRLRGCVGMISPRQSLRETVRECAQAAATRDTRFHALSREELSRARIDISVLTPPVPVAEFGTIEVGRHGLIVSRGHQRGLLLPQVASEEGWNRETFLDHTCRKAGLPPGDWRRGASVEMFEAVVFGDDAP